MSVPLLRGGPSKMIGDSSSLARESGVRPNQLIAWRIPDATHLPPRGMERFAIAAAAGTCWNTAGNVLATFRDAG